MKRTVEDISLIAVTVFLGIGIFVEIGILICGVTL